MNFFCWSYISIKLLSPGEPVKQEFSASHLSENIAIRCCSVGLMLRNHLNYAGKNYKASHQVHCCWQSADMFIMQSTSWDSITPCWQWPIYQQKFISSFESIPSRWKWQIVHLWIWWIGQFGWWFMQRIWQKYTRMLWEDKQMLTHLDSKGECLYINHALICAWNALRCNCWVHEGHLRHFLLAYWPLADWK